MKLELTTKTLICKKLDDIPNFKDIESLERGIQWKIIFSNKIKSKREKIGKKWKREHVGFQIGIHLIEPEINIVKLITDKEIEEHQDFFEKCAKDYRNLASKLIFEFMDSHNIEIKEGFPMITLHHTNTLGYEPVGKMGKWRYAFHGIHLAMTNIHTEQHIEIPLNYGLEFGQLDPWFFIRFIKSTDKYSPLPTGIYCDYEDGARISQKMVMLGKFEYINSNWENEKGIVVTDREKVVVKVYKPKKIVIKSKLPTNSSTSKNSNKIKFWSKIKRLFQ